MPSKVYSFGKYTDDILYLPLLKDIGVISPIINKTISIYQPKNWSIQPTLPDGLQIDSKTGDITGMPTYLSDDTYIVTAKDVKNEIVGKGEVKINVIRFKKTNNRKKVEYKLNMMNKNMVIQTFI